MNQQEAIDRLIYLHSVSPFSMSESQKFETYELSRQLYEDTGNVAYLEIAYSTGYITNNEYKLREYLRAIEMGREEFAFDVACIYFKGEAGKVDYEKAYEYFLRASKTGKFGDGSFVNSYKDVSNDAKYYLAIMYKNGLGVEKNYSEYVRIMNELYENFMNVTWYEDYDAKKILEIGEMLLEKGDVYRYCELLFKSRNNQGMWIKNFNTNVNELKKLNDNLYKTIKLDLTEIEPLDITVLVKKPAILLFRHNNKQYRIEVLNTEEGLIIDYDNSYFKDAEDLIRNGFIGEESFNTAMFDTYGWEVIE